MAFDPSHPRPRVRSQGGSGTAPSVATPSGGGGGFLSKLRKKPAPDTAGTTPAAPSPAGNAPEPASPPPAAPGTPPAAGGAQHLSYDGTTGQLFKVFFRNLLFNLLTLGLYHPWAKTNYRRYLWSRVSFGGDRFEYTGTGGELFKGMMVGSVLMLLLYGGVTVAISTVGTRYGENAGAVAGVTLTVVALGFLTQLARFSARRYRYSRTVWRGVRLGVRGSALSYAAYGMTQGLLTLLTLGLYAPWAHSNTTARITRATTVGAQHLEYDGTGRGLLKPWLVAWLLMLPTFGLVTFWYLARSHRYIAEHTSLQGKRFSSDVTGRKLFNLIYGNQLIMSFTFGLGLPLVLDRKMRFLCEHHALHGGVDFAAIRQGAYQSAGEAEGLSEVLEVGDIGFG